MLTAAQGTGDARAAALGLEGIAGARSLSGRDDDAARLLGAAAAAREPVGLPLPKAERGDVDRVTERVRVRLGETGFGKQFTAGYGSGPEPLFSGGCPHPDLAGSSTG